MSSFALEEFVGNGVLRDQMDSFIADGWADVPTLKFMSKEDMDTLQLSQMQRVRRIILHCRAFHDLIAFDFGTSC